MINLDPTGVFSSGCTGINDSGQVVGYYSAMDSSLPLPFLYQDGQRVNLNSLLPANSGWQLGIPRIINNQGWIVGAGSFNGEGHTYLLRPVAVPEPSALALLFGSGLTLGWLRCRRGVK